MGENHSESQIKSFAKGTPPSFKGAVGENHSERIHNRVVFFTVDRASKGLWGKTTVRVLRAAISHSPALASKGLWGKTTVRVLDIINVLPGVEE